jgi:hypothetical protein
MVEKVHCHAVRHTPASGQPSPRRLNLFPVLLLLRDIEAILKMSPELGASFVFRRTAYVGKNGHTEPTGVCSKDGPRSRPISKTQDALVAFAETHGWVLSRDPNPLDSVQDVLVGTGLPLSKLTAEFWAVLQKAQLSSRRRRGAR